MEMLNKKTPRNSNIELLKIISMVVIVFAHQIDAYHYSGVGGTVDFLGVAPTTDPQFLLLSFVGPLGLFADVVFIACSAFFLLESNRISIKKIFFLMATDVIVMCSALVVKASIGDEITKRQILEAIFSTFIQVNWFVGYYIVFYLLHPFFNYVIKKLDGKGLAIVTAILVFQCNIILFGMGNTPGSMGLKLLCFIAIYFAVALYKYYGGKLWESKIFNIVMLVVGLAVYVAFRIAMNYIGLKSEYIAARQYGYSHISNPIIIVCSLAAINLANRHPRQNKVINYFSGLSLVLYLVHKNLQFRTHAGYMEYFLDTYGAQSFLGFVFTSSLIVLGLGLALSVLYRHTVYYGVMALGGVIEKCVLKGIDKVKTKLNAKKSKQNTVEPDQSNQETSAAEEENKEQ